MTKDEAIKEALLDYQHAQRYLANASLSSDGSPASKYEVKEASRLLAMAQRKLDKVRRS